VVTANLPHLDQNRRTVNYLGTVCKQSHERFGSVVAGLWQSQNVHHRAAAGMSDAPPTVACAPLNSPETDA